MWIEKLTGDLGQKKQYREFKARIAALPQPYRAAGKALERYLMYLGPANDGAVLVAMLGDLADLLEQAAADGTPLRQVVGEDPAEFADTFIAGYEGGSWIRRERERLADAIAEAERP
ncbi:DUF1048 domain-containing protein [Serinibacter salmoneus]|uniref:DNA-binding ferritin-like protein (Dps family) n=1 Tax=Serinibacter salmoneus TaxID=556530 RepID=A0A2A9D4M5_9MICO|nr:DUF1048 domain-containing protein [Serinibacter salmoneus]PFG21205.1 DNA-binding ferritin-like protein (Dps family) [Serinibacter salmoneus]